jgi:hypothetical protein
MTGHEHERPEPRIPAATAAAGCRVLESIFEAEYPGTKWTIRYDPNRATEPATTTEVADGS